MDDMKLQDAGMLRNMLSSGLSMGFMSSLVNIGTLTLQTSINKLGQNIIIAHTAARKISEIFMIMFSVFGQTMATYCGQNLGAGEITRIKKGVHASSFLAFLTSAFISIVMFLFGKTLLSMFISGDPEQTSQVLAIAWHYLSIMASCLCILYFLYVYRSALQGLGNTMIPMLSGVVEFFVRVGVALLLPKLIGQNGIFYAEIAAWTGAAVLLMISYYINIRKFA